MVTMEFAINLDWGRLARALLRRVLLWDTGQAGGRGPSWAQHVADGGEKLFAFPLIGSVTVQGREERVKDQGQTDICLHELHMSRCPMLGDVAICPREY